MKLTVFILLACGLHVSAETFAQSVSLKAENKPLATVLRSIKKQTGYSFIARENILDKAGRVTVDLKDVPIREALISCLKGQPLTFSIDGNVIIIKRDTAIAVAVSSDRQLKSNGTFDGLKDTLVDVTGRVMDEDNKGIARATVSIKDTKTATLTNEEGGFTLDADSKSVLVVSCVGYEAQHLPVNGKGSVVAKLKQAVNGLDETVVVAYNTTTQWRNVSALTVVKKDQVENLPVRSIDKALQGLVPGLLVTSGTGQPGGGLSNFVIRGISTAVDPFQDNATVRNPLIVIDGVPITQDNYQWQASRNTPIINPMAQLNMADFESITVLKDAAAIALYGSKASNGVILLTSKKGKAGKTVIGFHSQADITTRLKGKVEFVNQQEYLDLVSESLRNYSSTMFPNEAAVTKYLKQSFPLRSDSSFYPFVNWEDEIYTKTAGTFVNNLSFSGGTDKSNFYLNLGFTKQNGVVKKTGYDQKAIRFNFDNRPTSWFKWGFNTGLTYNIQNYGVPLGSNIGASADDSPLNPVRLEDGSYFLTFINPTKQANPVAANEYNTNANKSYRGISKLNGEINFLKNFRFNSTLGVDFMLLEAKQVTAVGLYGSNTPNSEGMIRERNTRNWNLITTNQLSYNSKIGKDHSLNVLLGQEAQVMSTKFVDVTGTKINIPGIDQISGTASRDGTGGENKKTLLSLFGQANYGYKNRYFISTSVRADGSSNFGERNRFGKFWSAGAGWVATEESFMKGAAGWLSYLKLRGSIGAAGNSFAVNRYARYDQLYYGNYLNSLAVYPDQGSAPGNPDIQWERTFTWDAGLEARLWSDRLLLTADIYEKKTFDAVSTISLGYVTGYASVPDNIGDINNKGIELSLAIDIIKSRDFRWNINANWSTNKNTLVKLSNPVTYVGGTTNLANLIGKPLNAFYMIQWAGVDPATGAALWIDSTGKPNTNPATAKPSYAGKPAPDGFGAITNSFTWKNIQVSALLYYQYGYQVNTTGLVNDGYSPFQNQDKSALNRWQKPGDISPNPKRQVSVNSANTSTRFLYSGDYIRFQTLTLGYTFPKKILSRLGLSMLKVYAQAYNLAIWTKYPGSDLANLSPLGDIITGGQYPNGQAFSMGIDLNF